MLRNLALTSRALMRRSATKEFFAGHAAQAHEYVDAAIKLNPNNPAIGYFYWVRGRAFVNQGCWSDAVEALQKSVYALKTVWYNRAYLCYAKQKNGNLPAPRVHLLS